MTKFSFLQGSDQRLNVPEEKKTKWKMCIVSWTQSSMSKQAQ